MGFLLEGDCVNSVAFGFAGSCAIYNLSAVAFDWIFWLSVATSAIFIVLAVPRMLYLSRCPLIARLPAVLLVSKVVVGAVLAGLRLGLVVLASQHVNRRTPRLVASTTLEFAASCLLLALLPLEHLRRPRPSILACSYLLLALVYNVARCPFLYAVSRRNHDVSGNMTTFTGLFTATVVLNLILLILESMRRRRWLAWDAVHHSPEETSSILSLGLYSWLNSLLWRGYHEPLTMQHLYALDRAVSVDTFAARSAPSDESMETSVWHLSLWLAKPLGRSVLLPVFPRLCLLGFTFCQPFFLQRLLRFLSSHESDSSTASCLVAIAVLTYSGIAITTALYWYYQERFQSLLRGFLISAIYRKTANMPHVGDGDTAAVTLMGADVERIYTGLRLIHEVWANAIQIALAAWLLERQLGLAFLAPLLLVLLGFAGSFAISGRAVRFQGAWMARVQARIGVTSAVLDRIKDLRFSGMVGPAAALMQRERQEEIHVGERSRVLIALSATLSQLPQALAPSLAFAFGPHVLDQTRAYTALSFLTLLTAPLLIVLQSLPIIAACVACLRRIKVFLIDEERVDRRVLLGPAGDVSEKTEKLDAGRKEPIIVVTDCCFGWKPNNPTLKNVNLSLPRSSITFVVGPVASGKSTLCRALLDEVAHMQGTMAFGSDKVGYCDQVPFLFNASIQENITGFSSFDTVRYADVIHAAMLAEDLNSLPARDRTIVGTNGVSLSGGQRQRVALARALYHDADILVLDDIFSGLDGSTRDQVCQAVCGPEGLLRRRGTTAVVCTHSTHFLSVADHIVVLSSENTIVDQGSFAEIVRDEQRSGRAGLTSPRLAMKPPKPGTRSSGMGPQSIQAITSATEIPESERQGGVAPTEAKPPPTLTPDVDFAVYTHWLSTIGLLPLLLYLVLVVGIGFSTNFSTIWLKFWSEDSGTTVPRHSFAFWIGIYVLLGAGVILCVFPAGLVMLRTAVRLAGTDLHRAAVNTILYSSLRFLAGTDVGKVLNLFSQDMNIMDTQLPRMVNNLCFCLATAIGQAIVIALSSAWLAVSYPFFAALLWVVQHVYLPSSKRLRILDLEAKTPLYTHFLDTLAALPTIRAFGWFPNQLARNNALLDDSQRPSYLLAMAQQWLTLTMNVLVAIVAIMLVALATKLNSDAGNVGAGLVTLITLGGTLTAIVTAYTGLETSLGAISRLKSFSNETELEDCCKGEFVAPPKGWPTAGCVQIEKLEASYNGTNRVLEHLSLVIKAREKVAICGRTGSGKSSILALLLRLIEPLPPRKPSISASAPAPIHIDGLALHTIDGDVLRERIISVSQDPVFLPDGISFRVNLDPWDIASDVECDAVLRDLGLTTVVEAKGGLGAPMRGGELSAGQKQLFCLSRAVLRRRVKLRQTNTDGGLLLLDEVTSSTDAETERRMRKILEDEFSAYTVIMVTHRREMAMACDRVLVLSAGRVMEDGKPSDLLEREEGLFRKLWASEIVGIGAEVF